MMTRQMFRRYLLEERDALLANTQGPDDDEARGQIYDEYGHVLNAIDNGDDVEDACNYVGIKYIPVSN